MEESPQRAQRLRKQAEIRKLRGKLNWSGDLDAMREDELRSGMSQR